MSRGNKLLSVSKDGALRVWDLDTQHCSQTLAAACGEVWSLDVDPTETRVVTGGPRPAFGIDVVQSHLLMGSHETSIKVVMQQMLFAVSLAVSVAVQDTTVVHHMPQRPSEQAAEYCTLHSFGC